MGGAKKKAGVKETAAESLKRQKADAQGYQCKVCMQTFTGTAKPIVLKAHVDAKHPKGKTNNDCFPDIDFTGL